MKGLFVAVEHILMLWDNPEYWTHKNISNALHALRTQMNIAKEEIKCES